MGSKMRRRLVLLVVVSAAAAVAAAYYLGKRSREVLLGRDEWESFADAATPMPTPAAPRSAQSEPREEGPTEAAPIVVATMEATSQTARFEDDGFERDSSENNGSGGTTVEPEPAHAGSEDALGSIQLQAIGGRRRRRSGVTLAILGALAGAGAIALGAWGIASSISNDDSGPSATTPLALQNVQQVVSLYTKPASTMIPIQGSGRSIILVVGAKGYGVLVLNGVQQPPGGKTYEAWVIVPKAAPKPAGLFAGGSGVVELTKRVPKGAIVAITVERAGGVGAPTQQPKLLATRT
jgi:hypothetical protein